MEQESEDRDQQSSGVYDSRGGRPGLPVPNSQYCLCGHKATLNDEHIGSCVKVRTVSVDVEQH